MKLHQILYWVFTGLLSIMMIMSAFFYFTTTEEVGCLFESLGYPASLVIPLAVANTLAGIAFVSNKSALLKRLAYVGLALDFVLALIAHLMAGDGEFGGAVIALVLLAGSYYYNGKVNKA